MNEILHANIFFVIASVGVVLFTVLVSLVLYQVLKITKSVRRIIERVEAGSETVAADVAQFREAVVSGAPARIIKFFVGRSTRRRDDDEE